ADLLAETPRICKCGSEELEMIADLCPTEDRVGQISELPAENCASSSGRLPRRSVGCAKNRSCIHLEQFDPCDSAERFAFGRGRRTQKVSIDVHCSRDIAFPPQILVRWLSGRKRRFAKALYWQRYRGFESPPHRRFFPRRTALRLDWRSDLVYHDIAAS